MVAVREWLVVEEVACHVLPLDRVFQILAPVDRPRQVDQMSVPRI